MKAQIIEVQSYSCFNALILCLQLAYQNKSGLMVIYKRISNKPYKIKYSSYDIHDIANIEKKVPLEWIDTKNNYVKQDLIDYMKPLIQGEVKQIYEDGLPKHIVL